MKFKHISINLINCNVDFSLDNEKRIKQILYKIVKILKVRVKKTIIQKFKPQGLTIVFSLAESHLSYHSWTEFNTVFIDIFTCGKVSPTKTIPILKKEFKPKKIEKTLIKRNVG